MQKMSVNELADMQGKRKGRTGTSQRTIGIMLKVSPTKLDEYPIDDLRLSPQVQLRT
jgi:hypothetical protein